MFNKNIFLKIIIIFFVHQSQSNQLKVFTMTWNLSGVLQDWETKKIDFEKEIDRIVEEVAKDKYDIVAIGF